MFVPHAHVDLPGEIHLSKLAPTAKGRGDDIFILEKLKFRKTVQRDWLPNCLPRNLALHGGEPFLGLRGKRAFGKTLQQLLIRFGRLLPMLQILFAQPGTVK